MRILFVGDASAVHFNLARGLRELGHEATVVSSRLGWRNYEQDILLDRAAGRWGAIRYVCRLLRLLPRFRGYDIVQIVGPHFLELKSKRLWQIYDFLLQHNRRVVMTALGDDYYWMWGSVDRHLFRYGDFNIGPIDRRADFEYARHTYDDWTLPLHQSYCEHIATTAHAIVAVLYEYWLCYHHAFPEKTSFLPLPVILPANAETDFAVRGKLRLFIGIQKERSRYKGTDVMLMAAQSIVAAYPDKAELTVVENLPYAQYLEALKGHDVILDQLYSYTPAMNALIAMANGLVCVGGGEPENYEILQETELRPIVNVLPNYESVYQALEQLVMNPQEVAELKRQSVDYVRRHHDYRQVARRYAQLYAQLLSQPRNPQAS